MFVELFHELEKQCEKSCSRDCFFEIQYHTNERMTTGAKRDSLLHTAQGKYIVFIDDDDQISENYVALIKQAAMSEPDCIGMRGYMTTNGADMRKWSISLAHGKWYEENGIYYRTPNHISPVKKEIALKAGFPDKSFGEDAEYSENILPLLKTEVYIDEEIYHYRFVSQK